MVLSAVVVEVAVVAQDIQLDMNLTQAAAVAVDKVAAQEVSQD